MPLLANDNRCSAIAGRVIYRQRRSSFFRWLDLQDTPACIEKPDCLLTSSLDFALLALVGTTCLNGVYDAKGYFWPVKPPTCEDLDVIAHKIARRVSGFLEKAGYLVRDAESEYLDLMQDEEDAMGAIVGASITYRLAFGPNAGRKALTLQTVQVRTEQRKGDDLVSQQAGFSLHAGIACDIEKCEKCGGPVRIIASIEDPDVIQKILKHLGLDQPEDPLIRSPPADLTDQQTTPF